MRCRRYLAGRSAGGTANGAYRGLNLGDRAAVSEGIDNRCAGGAMGGIVLVDRDAADTAPLAQFLQLASKSRCMFLRGRLEPCS